MAANESFDSVIPAWWQMLIVFVMIPIAFLALMIIVFLLQKFVFRDTKTTKDYDAANATGDTKPTITTEQIRGATMDTATIYEVYLLFNTFFANEFNTESEFSKFIRADGRDVILFRDPNRPAKPSLTGADLNFGKPVLCGFAVLTRKYREIDYIMEEPSSQTYSTSISKSGSTSISASTDPSSQGSDDEHEPSPAPTPPSSKKKYRFISVTNEFFALHRDYRSLPTSLFAVIKYCIWTKLTNPFTPLYYFFVTYSYKSYLAFGRTLGDYYPKHSVPVPPRVKQILRMLGTEAAGSWGVYNEKNYIINDTRRDAQSGRLKLQLSEPREITATIQYFLDTDADYVNGDCLCVISNLSWRSICASLWKALARFRARRGPPKRPTNLPAAVKPVVIHGGSGERVIIEDPDVVKEDSNVHSPDAARLQLLVGPTIFKLSRREELRRLRTIPIVDALALECASRLFTARVITKRRHIQELKSQKYDVVDTPTSSMSESAEVSLPLSMSSIESPTFTAPQPTGPLGKLLRHVTVGRPRKAKVPQGIGGEESPQPLQHISQHIYERRHKSMLLCSLSALDEAAVACTRLLALAMTPEKETVESDKPENVAPLDELRELQRIHSSRLAKHISLGMAEDVISFWLSNKFDWPSIRSELDGSVPQYITLVGGRQLHYLHLKSNATQLTATTPISPLSSFNESIDQEPSVRVIPLLLLHGDLSTPFETIPLFADLVKPTNSIAFHVVAPSMPGCGLSVPPTANGERTRASSASPTDLPEVSTPPQPPLRSHRTSFAGLFKQNLDVNDKASEDLINDPNPIVTSAILLAHLMIHTLGYHRFAIAATGKYSTHIGCAIASEFPDNCIGIYCTSAPSALAVPSFRRRFTANSRLRLKSWLFTHQQQQAIHHYQRSFMIQGHLERLTKNLRSVESILAVLIQSYRNLCTSEDSVWYWPLTTFITNVIIYWATGTLPRAYQLLMIVKAQELAPVDVPVGYTAYPSAVNVPRELSQAYQWKNFSRSVRMPTGGPFPAFECPGIHVADIREFFRLHGNLKAL